MNHCPLRILVVEDEMLLAVFVEGCLIQLGHIVVGPASRVANALRLVETETVDFGLLDINIAGEEVYPVARQLKARGVPFIFMSGYGSSHLRDEWIGRPLLGKPIDQKMLKASIETLVRGEA